MSGRILVVDDTEPNVRLLRAKLEAEYYEVLSAGNGKEAIEVARKNAPDLILMDAMMPVMDGFEACRLLKDDPLTRHIPVVMVTALDGQQDRVRGLRAGADDFLTKPIDDMALFARVRSLLRLKLVMDELRQREACGRAMGAINGPALDPGTGQNPARILILDEDERQAARTAGKIGPGYDLAMACAPRLAAAQLEAQGFDLLIVNLAARSFDGLRLCARIRSDGEGRHMPILALVDPDNRDRMVRALDIGVNDVLMRPVDAHELVARVSTQLRRKRYTDTLRRSLDNSFELSVTDQLTGLHNRRFMQSRLADSLNRLQRGVETTSLLIADVDLFKAVNDRWGHDSGDKILQEMARRMKLNMRAIDISCRYGGEEFVVVMPGADLDAAMQAAERLRAAIEEKPFSLGDGQGEASVTISVGVAEIEPCETVEQVLIRADRALYAAKNSGRNCVMSASAAPDQAAAGARP